MKKITEKYWDDLPVGTLLNCEYKNTFGLALKTGNGGMKHDPIGFTPREEIGFIIENFKFEVINDKNLWDLYIDECGSVLEVTDLIFCSMNGGEYIGMSKDFCRKTAKSAIAWMLNEMNMYTPDFKSVLEGNCEWKFMLNKKRNDNNGN